MPSAGGARHINALKGGKPLRSRQVLPLRIGGDNRDLQLTALGFTLKKIEIQRPREKMEPPGQGKDHAITINGVQVVAGRSEVVVRL
jgi:hypothetical protein